MSCRGVVRDAISRSLMMADGDRQCIQITQIDGRDVQNALVTVDAKGTAGIARANRTQSLHGFATNLSTEEMGES